MENASPRTLLFKRSHFATHLPVDALYSPTHYWLARDADGLWRVGFTKFAVRMLGELVDHAFTLPAGTAIQPGALLGWVEGFKAITDVYGVVDGVFHGANPALAGQLDLVQEAPYGEGWLYRAAGEPDRHCVSAEGYAALLHTTIDQLSDPPSG